MIYRRLSPEQSAAVSITRETAQPRWTGVEMFARGGVRPRGGLHTTKVRSLLFLNSSRRTLGFYENLAEQYTAGAHRILPLSRINRVLAELQNPEFFNIGMKNVIPHGQSESYRIVTGPRVHEAIRESDGRLYHRGHAFGKFEYEGQPVTLGYSSASKVWSIESITSLSCFIGAEIWRARSYRPTDPMATGSGFYALQVGEEAGRAARGFCGGCGRLGRVRVSSRRPRTVSND